MLTPIEIQSKSFKSVGLGYDKKDVDNYMRDIVSSYETVYRENMELKDRVAVLNEAIQNYRGMEKTLQKAIVLAQKTAEDTINNASKEAKRIEKEATVKANIMLADAKNELEGLHQQTIRLIQQYEKYKAQFKNLAAAQIEMLSSEAFSINVQNLDAFLSNPVQLEGLKSVETPRKPVNDEVNEIVAESNMVVSSGHLSDSDDDGDSEFDFSDFNIEGQEEFDFVDLNDN